MSFAITELLSGKVHYYHLPQYKRWKKVFCKHCNKPNFEDVDKDLMIDLHKWMSKSKILIGHNIDRFDIRKVTARFIKYGLEPLHKIQTIDTYKKHKQIADTSGNGLNHITKYYSIGKKYETMKNLAKKCLEGDMSAWKEFKKYNIQDVVINEKLYLKERGWYKGAPNLNTIYQSNNCPKCQSDQFTKRGKELLVSGAYQGYLCMNCGHRFRGEKIEDFKPTFR